MELTVEIYENYLARMCVGGFATNKEYGHLASFQEAARIPHRTAQEILLECGIEDASRWGRDQYATIDQERRQRQAAGSSD